ncbi:hypothetical protein AZH53_03140 [Methanomicrobiaceae archaeon CYW5]|uniref:tyrosine-type recombinase/integrase n=1 Tax=Methanovulcanius yangii TaxID=1789227 RepID=UPI0029CA5B1E|nr:tyrosine-type recombinase/integrase [Methanovulcanius yangii]MBT8507424.1 hypothetical protein [Methanovulcanius yangii]
MRNERFHKKPETYRVYEKRSIQNALDNGTLTPADANYIREFIAEISVTANLSAQRRFKLVSNLVQCHRFLPSVEDLVLSDIYEGIESLRVAIKEDGTKYSQNTIADFIRVTKRYYLWLIENNKIDVPIAKIKNIKCTRYNYTTKTEEDILTEEEVQQLIHTPRSIQYKALLGVAYEGGFRIHEIGQLQWKDVRFMEGRVRIYTDGKTGKLRKVPIIAYAQYLAEWKSIYPGNPEGENFVFLNKHNQPLYYQSFAKTFRQFAKDAGIERKVSTHILRHSRITHCLRQNYNPVYVALTFWGNINTSMLKTYTHLSDDDVERQFARLAGVDIPELADKSDALAPVQCYQCGQINPPGTEYCSRCGLALSAEAQATHEAVIQKIEEILASPGGAAIFKEAIARVQSQSE